MPLKDDLQTLLDEGRQAFMAAADTDALEQVRIEYLGRGGRLKEVTKAFEAEPTQGTEASIGCALGSGQPGPERRPQCASRAGCWRLGGCH